MPDDHRRLDDGLDDIARLNTIDPDRVVLAGHGSELSQTLTTTFTSSQRHRVIELARSGIGVWSYGRGTEPPVLDCSGYTRYCVLHVTGYEMPWNSTAQSDYHLNPLVRTVAYTLANKRLLRPADLVFYYPGITHVAMFSYVSGRKWHVVQGTNQVYDMQEIFMEQYARPVALGFLAH